MEDKLIKFKTAKLAKEKGFDDDNCRMIYYGDFEEEFKPETIEPSDRDIRYSSVGEFEYLASTQSLLQRWLREVHFIHVQPQKHFFNKGYKIGKILIAESSYNGPHNKKYNTYEEALEEGLQVALKLIK